MAFNINAQIILSQPKNLNNISNQITKQLGKATKLNINIGNAKQLTTLSKQLTTLNNSFTKLNSNMVSVGKSQNVVNSQISKTNQSLKTQSGLVGSLGKRFGSVAKQAVAFGLISRPIYDLQRALTQAVKDAVKFEREIVRISQVTGRSVADLNSLTTQISKLSTELGINANELAETSRVIAQAGIRGKELDQVLTALARSTLAPTFGKITDTTEGLIAAFGQFGLKGRDAEAILGSLNKVSKEFAVEAEDLISVVRRTGGVFAQAAGDTKGTIGALQELTSIFTAVRSTTRESADTIAAGLRTIFSRIQRRGTIDFLRQFNVDLVDAKGNFVGIFPAFEQLSKRLDTLIKQGDALTLSAIAEELGGIRQIGKLLPAIAQFDKAQNALKAAQRGAAEGLAGDVSKALDTTEKRVAKVRESFKQLIRTVFESDAFQNFTKNILASANSFLQFANTISSALEPILPILTAIGAFKLGRGLGGIIGGGVGKAVSGAVTSATGSTAGAQAAQKTAAAVTSQTQLITNTNSILTRMSNQLNNIFQVNNSGFNQIAKAITTKPTGGIAGVGGRRRASGGVIPKFANGGRVYGPSHAGGGVIAELEGGEYVVPKKYVKGTPKSGVKGGKGKKNAYVFDFDDTLATTEAKGFKDFNDPSFIRSAQATRYSSLAKRRARRGDDIHVLTARFGSQGIIKAIQNFMTEIGAPAKSVIAVGGAFKNEREPGKRPGTTRKIGTATKKAKILTNLAKRYNEITFLDDNLENIVKASEVKGVRPVTAEAGKLFGKGAASPLRRAAGGLIPGYAKGEIVAKKRVGILFQDSNLSESDPADKRASISKKQLSRTAQSQLKGINKLTLENIEVSKFSRETNFEKQRDIVTNAISTAVAGLNKSIGQIRGANGRKAPPIPKDKITKTADLTLGRVFEDYVTGLAGLSSPGTKNFDLIGSEVTAVNSSGLAAGPVPDPTDIKLNLGKSSLESVVKKAYNEGIFANEIAAQQGAKRKASGRGRRGAAAGGFIQKLATGDIVRARSVGVAILDPDDAPDGSAKVGVKDIESQIGFTKGTARGFSGVGAALKKNNFNGSYKIIKQGLNQKTSERFNKVLAEGLIKGVDFAASELSGDLGLGPTNIDQASKTKFIQSQRSALRGDLFEAALSSLNNRGKFDNAVDFARPFDFPNGLQGPFADNFSKLPSKFVDAKSSVAAAPDSNIRGKIIREIAADVVKTDPNILAQKDRQTGGKASKKSPRQARGFGALTFASGGEVPVRISNGEMVVTDPKEVAANRGKLQSINKLATGGFASGTIARGPGTGTSDSILTTLPEGAFVVNAASTKKYLGLRRGGGVKRFKDGGTNISDLTAARRGAAADLRFAQSRGDSVAARQAEQTIKELDKALQKVNKNLDKNAQSNARASKKIDLNSVATQRLSAASSLASKADLEEANSSKVAAASGLGAAAADKEESAASLAAAQSLRQLSTRTSTASKDINQLLGAPGPKTDPKLQAVQERKARLAALSPAEARTERRKLAAGRLLERGGQSPDQARRLRSIQQSGFRRTPLGGGGGAGGAGGAGGFGGNLLGVTFALQALTSTLFDADSAAGKLSQSFANTILTLGLFSQIVPQSLISKVGGAIGVGGKASFLPQTGAIGATSFGGLAAGVGGVAAAGIAGGVLGKIIGDQVGNVVLGERKNVGEIRGDGNLSRARSRANFGAGGAVLGGAAAGAALGSFVPVIGTALGAAIGAGSGLLIAALTAPLDVAAQEAAFNIAQRLQDGGKAIKDSLDKLNKDFNSISFGNFAREFNDQTKDLTTSIPKLAENLDKASRFRGRRKAELDVARSFKDIIKPEDLEKSRAAISQGLQKLFENIGDQDLSNILSTGNTEQFNQALAQAAQNGNLFAKEVLVSRNNLATQNALLKAGELADKKRSEEEKKTGIVLQNVARNFDFVTGSAAELDQAILKVAGENNLSAAETRFARTEIKKFAEDQKKGAQEEAKALAQQQQLNRALEESAQSVNAFNLAVRESVAGLTESLARSGEKFDLFAQRVADIESGSGAVRLDTSLANRGSDEVVSIIEKTSGRNLDAFRNLDNVQKNLPNIVKAAVESIPATAGTQQTTDALIRAIQQQSGLQVSGDFQKGLETRIRALISSRQTQGGDDTILAGKALAEALDKGEIDKLLGEVVQEQQTAFEELKKNAEVLRKQFENRINFEISRLKQAKAFEQKIFSKRLSNENIINNILNRNVNQLDQAFSNLNRQLQTTAGTTNIGALLGQREQALAGKRQLEQQIELGDTSAETANQLIEFSRQLTESDAALKQFAEDTSIAAAIQAEASKLQQQRSAAESAIESIVSAGLGGDQGALKAISSQVQAFDRFQAGQASFKDVISVFKNIEGPILSALAGDQAKEIKRFATGILAAQFKGTPAEGIIKRLQGQSVNVQERIFGLAQEANRINNLQLQTLYAIQQQNEVAIGQAGAGTDPFSASVNVFSQAVGAFADVVARGGGGVFAGGGPVNRAAGGIIYKNQGGVSDGTLVGEFASRFSKGTDTIPAMLSPGEYVISAPAVSKVGVGTLDAINSGNVATKSKGGILYREDGGEVTERIRRAKQQLKDVDINLGSFISDYDLNLLKFEKKEKTDEPYPRMIKNDMYQAISNIVRNKDTAAMPDVFTRIIKDNENRISFEKYGLWKDKNFTEVWYDVMAQYMDSSLKSNIQSERGLSTSTKDKIARTGVSILNMARRGSTNSNTREFSGSLRGQVFLDPKNKFGSSGFESTGPTGAGSGSSGRGKVEFPLSGTDGSELATLFNFTQVLGANDRKKLYRQGFLEVNKDSVRDSFKDKDLQAEYRQQIAERLPAIISMLIRGKAQADAFRQQYAKQYFNIPNIFDLPYILNEKTGVGIVKGRYYDDIQQLINDKLSGYHFMLNKGGSQDNFQKLMRPDILEALKNVARSPQGWVDSYFAARNNAGVEMKGLDLLINKDGTSSVFDQSLRSSLNPNNVMLSKSHTLLTQFLINAQADAKQASNTYLKDKSKELSGFSLKKLKEIRSSDVTYPGGPVGSPYKLLSLYGLPFTLGDIENEINRKEAEKAAAGEVKPPEDDAKEPVDPADEFLKTKADLYNQIFSGKNDSPIYDINQKILKSNAFIETLKGKKPTPNIQRLLSRQYAINRKLIGIRAKKIFNLTRSAGALWENDPLLRNPPDKGGLTVNEKQAVGQYNQLYAQALFTNDQNKYADAEKFLQDFLSSGSPNSTKIRDRIAFVKRFLKITDNTLPIFHQGGLVQGYSKGGDVPIMAQQGEFIMNRRAVDRVGLGNMMSINNGGFGGGSTSLAKPIVELTRGIIGLSRLSQNIANLTASLNNPTLVAGMYQAFNDGAIKLSLALQPLNNIPEYIEMRLAPVDIAGLDGFTQQVVDGVINKLIDMSVIGQPVAQNAPTIRPGTDLYS